MGRVEYEYKLGVIQLLAMLSTSYDWRVVECPPELEVEATAECLGARVEGKDFLLVTCEDGAQSLRGKRAGQWYTVTVHARQLAQLRLRLRQTGE